ncbi:uncharacterized protein VTP21DRAFT_693 [Calcarisporiella thermophila]|uniref:uncharacterized protein n=1 Tax=Calcarisporiella thermophila TaxID=911321 RepID=UPI003742BCF2
MTQQKSRRHCKNGHSAQDFEDEERGEACASEDTPFLPHASSPRSPSGIFNRLKTNSVLSLLFLVLLALIFAVLAYLFLPPLPHPGSKRFSELKDFCRTVPPLPAAEYGIRRQRLARALQEENARGLVLEPGAMMQYFVNITWSQSERPFVVVIDAEGEVVVLTPSFEKTRARDAVQKADGLAVRMVEWGESEDPFKILAGNITGPVQLDDGLRYFVASGLSKHITTTPSSPRIKAIRRSKTLHELNLLRCVNQATARALRLVKNEIRVGMSEETVKGLVFEALETAGLTNTWAIVSVDAHAALPHGGRGGSRVEKDSLVLIDMGGEYQQYQSDLTRTFTLSSSLDANRTDIWNAVQSAQQQAIRSIRPGVLASDVDAVARRVIEEAGYGAMFTHRLGHGIGLEVHEEPYLHAGNERPLQVGDTFSVEPGVYWEGFTGVRLEDIVEVTEDGASVLAGPLATSPRDP